MKNKIFRFVIYLAIPLGAGFLSYLLTKDSIADFATVNQPPLTPPPIVFSIAWTILYALMGVSSWLVGTSPASDRMKKSALTVYGIQLAVNILWPVFFFNLKMYLPSFIWIIFLIVWVIIMIKEFGKISSLAAKLQLPYLIWLLFASYLNLGVYFLN